MSLDKRFGPPRKEPKIALPKTDLSAEEFLGHLEKLLSGEATGQEVADKLSKARQEIQSNRNKLLGENHRQ